MSFINSSSQIHSTPPPLKVRGTKNAPFVLRNAAPIATTIGENAFSAQSYRQARLFINNVPTPFVSAEINAPRKTLGKTLQIQLARTNLSQLAAGATFKFQIIKMVSGVEVPVTILDGANLLGKNYSVSLERDSLSFSTNEGLSDKLSKCPLNNLIVYDGNKQIVSTDEIESLRTNTGEVITTGKRDLRPLTLYKLLDVAFVEGCGFTSVSTNIPNSELVQCVFSISQTYESAVAPFLGIWEPEFSEKDGVLQILTPFADLPTGFVVRTLPHARISGFSQNTQLQSANIDGYVLQYMTDGGNYFDDRALPPVTSTSGEYGTAGYTETTTVKTLREWKESPSSEEVLRSETKSEIVETRIDSELAGRQSVEYTFDRLGRSTGYTRTLEARMPDVNNSNLPSLLETRTEAQIITYKTNPFASRLMYQSRIENRVSALLAVDAENMALDRSGNLAAYKQDYEKVFEAGNLRSGMTSEFAVMETEVTEFIPKRNGQVEVRVTSFDAVRGKPKPPRVDVRSGDISVPNYLKQKNYPIFKEGVTQATRTGKPMPPFNVGELPFFFAEPLTIRKLAYEPVGGQIEVPGFDESIERGVLFALDDRDGTTLGNFLTSGYRVSIQPNSIKTTIDAIKI